MPKSSRPMTKRESEQKLIDICFELVLLTQNEEYAFKSMSRDGLMEWVAQQLRASGYDTVPIGASWGMLKK